MDLIVGILKIVAPISVGLVLFAQGLAISPGRVVAYFKERPGVMLRSLVAALLLVPAAALAIILVLKPSPGVGVGLAILVTCPPAPLMLSTAPKKGRASAVFMASLHLSLAALAFLTVQITLDLISRPLGFHADVDLGAMTWILAKSILIPVGLGLTVRALSPGIADRLTAVLEKVGMVGLRVVVLFALVSFYPALLNMDRWSYLVIAVVSATALAIGHLLGPSDPDEKTTLAVECGVRHPALALAIASANFSPEKALPVLIPCVLTFIAVATVYMAWRGRSAGSRRHLAV